MFEGATRKLEDARTAIDRLKALAEPAVTSNIRIVDSSSLNQVDPLGTGDPLALAEAFSSSVTHVRAVGDAVFKDKLANTLPGFPAWRKAKISVCKDDELLKFIADQRNFDVHEGATPLTFAMQAWAFSSAMTGPTPADDAVLLVDGSGPYWLVARGTSRERRVPCVIRPGFQVSVALADPPAAHQGRPLQPRDPLSICVVAERFHSDLVFEAKERFRE